MIRISKREAILLRDAVEFAIKRFQTLEDAEENTLNDDRAHAMLVKASRLIDKWEVYAR